MVIIGVASSMAIFAVSPPVLQFNALTLCCLILEQMHISNLQPGNACNHLEQRLG